MFPSVIISGFVLHIVFIVFINNILVTHFTSVSILVLFNSV